MLWLLCYCYANCGSDYRFSVTMYSFHVGSDVNVTVSDKSY